MFVFNGNSGDNKWDRFKSAIFKYVLDIILSVVIPIVQLTFAMLLVLGVSTTLYVIAKRHWVPKALINESVFFNFTPEFPVAKVGLNTLRTQWKYVDSLADVAQKPRFLHSGDQYDVTMWFVLAQSTKNYETGKITATLTMIDENGETVASSVRPLVVPYQSPPSRFFTSLLYLPFRIVGLISTTECVEVFVPFMNNFQEPSHHRPATDQVEIALSSAHFDVLDARLTIMPMLTGITFYMYHYPSLSFVVGVVALTVGQLMLYISAFLCALGVWHLTNGEVVAPLPVNSQHADPPPTPASRTRGAEPDDEVLSTGLTADSDYVEGNKLRRRVTLRSLGISGQEGMSSGRNADWERDLLGTRLFAATQTRES